MYLIISYDVESDYCNKILKILRKYLFHVHNSVFEGELTDKQKKELENQLNNKKYFIKHYILLITIFKTIK